MKRIKLGDREIDIQASPLTLLYYKKEFGQSFSSDLLEMLGEGARVDDVNLLQMAWAMEKTANEGKLVDFESWLKQFEYVDLLSGVAVEITGVAWDAAFRTAKKQEEAEEAPKSK